MSETEFANLGIKKSRRFSNARKNQRATVRGFDVNTQCYVESSGLLGEEIGSGLVEHFCSTNPGMSGSLVLDGETIIGIHVGALPPSDCNAFLLWSLVSLPFYLLSLKDNKKADTVVPSEDIVTESFWESDDQYYFDKMKKLGNIRGLARSLYDNYGEVNDFAINYTKEEFVDEIRQLELLGWGEDLDIDDFRSILTGDYISDPTLRSDVNKIRNRKINRENADYKLDFHSSSRNIVGTSLEPLKIQDVPNSNSLTNDLSSPISQDLPTKGKSRRKKKKGRALNPSSSAL
jgi:hypothetical protein